MKTHIGVTKLSGEKAMIPVARMGVTERDGHTIVFVNVYIESGFPVMESYEEIKNMLDHL